MTESKDDDNNNGIQVHLRIRPSTNPETYFHRDDIDLNNIVVKIPKNEDLINNSRSSYSFKFSSILDDKSSQKDVFRSVGIPSIKNALAGYNSTIFAYGQTGSGKTFTITGGPERYDDRGLIPRSLAYLYKAMKGEENNGTTYSCYISYIEIYNESGYDLLMESSQGNSAFGGEVEVPKVTLLEDEDGNFHFKNLSMHMVSSEEDALNLLFLGDTNRAIAATEMNQNSTRSHCIFSIVLEKRTAGTDTVIRSKLNIVDLAGSERVSRSNSAGQTLKEAKYINSSLFFLEMVIIALYEKEKRGNDHVHVPYRNSMMTSVLRDSLGGNCKTMMIATISPESRHTDESISTCHFAQRVALVKNSASVNEEVEPAQVIERLKAEVRRLREEVEFLSGKNDDDSSCDGDGDGKRSTALSLDQMNELGESIQKYVQDRTDSSQLDFCGGITLPKIRAVCSIFKTMLLESKERVAMNDGDVGGSDGESSSEDDSNNSPLPLGANTRELKKEEWQKQAQMQKQSASESRSPAKQSRVNSVCGVPICTDKRVIDEPNMAFSWFKDRHPSIAKMEKTKNSLKMKYTEAKTAGKSIDEIRSRISHHKEAISKLRKSYAISLVSGHDEEKMNEGEFSSKEKLHSDAIEKEKAAYKETLERLRELKNTIENTQKAMKEDRLKLQGEFDTWYHQVCYEESRTRTLESQNTNESGMMSRISENDDVIQARTIPPTDCGKSDDTKQHSSPPEVQNEFKLPPGIKLTGNPEADEDIIAFYQAKEVLLSRVKR